MVGKKLNNNLNGNVNLGRLQQPHAGPSDMAESQRAMHVRMARGNIPNANSYIIGYNRPNWLDKVFKLWDSDYRHVNMPYDSQLDALSRQYPKTSAPMGRASWIDSVNQVSIPRNMFVWHPVPELANLPVAGGSPGTVQQQYVLVQPSEQLVAGLLSARRLVPRSQVPLAYGQPLVTMSDTGIVVNQVVRSQPGLYGNLVSQAQSGSNFFTWLVRKIRGGS